MRQVLIVLIAAIVVIGIEGIMLEVVILDKVADVNTTICTKVHEVLSAVDPTCDIDTSDYDDNYSDPETLQEMKNLIDGGEK